MEAPYVTPEGDGLATFILDIILLVICIPVVAARFVIRIQKSALGIDDWLMGLGMAMTVVWSGLLITYCYSGGGYDPNDPRLNPEIISRALKFYFICQAFYCSVTVPIKVSICAALLRIAGPIRVYQISLWAIIVIASLSGFGSMIGIIASCSPPSAFWDADAGTCNPFVNAFFAYLVSACSILTDFALAILPAFMLWKIQLQRSIKISIAIILGFAAFASCATIVRLRYLLALLQKDNFLLGSGKIAIWTVVELMIGIVAGSAPALRPLLRLLPWIPSDSEDNSASPSQKRYKKSGSHIKMQSYPPDKSSFGESVVKRPEDNLVIEDGSSQEYILHGAPKGEIRRDYEVKVESTGGSGAFVDRR